MTEIKLDFDHRRQPDLEKTFYVLRCLGLSPTVARVSRSRHLGWHVYICVKERLQPGEIVAAQILCNSDTRRELFNLTRVLQLKHAPRYWRNKWNVLYEAD